MSKANLFVTILLVLLTAFAVWELKPNVKGDTEYIETIMPVDSASIISDANEGFWRGTNEEAIEKFGRVVRQIRRIDSLVVDSVTIYDTVNVAIPILTTSDSALFAGYNLVSEDTVKYSLQMRVNTIAYLEPVNAIENNIYLDSLKISIQKHDFTYTELAIEYWREMLIIFGLGWLLG